MSLLNRLKDWWWVVGVVGALSGAILVWGNLPERIAKAEQVNEKQAEQIDDLKGWAKEIQGYTRAMQVQQQPMPIVSKQHEWKNPDTGIWWCCAYDCDYNENWEKCDD